MTELDRQHYVEEVANLLARRHGPGPHWEKLTDVRPLELMAILQADAEAVVDLLLEKAKPMNARSESPLRRALVANLLDGDDAGLLTVHTRMHIDKIVEVVRDFLLDEEMQAAIIEDPEIAIDEMLERLGGMPLLAEETP